MFRANTTCTYRRRAGFNQYGEPSFKAAAAVPCSIVKLLSQTAQTSPRSETSATRANADERQAEATLLFPVKAKAAIGDRVLIRGVSMITTGVQPRLDVRGVHDHDEVSLVAWEG